MQGLHTSSLRHSWAIQRRVIGALLVRDPHGRTQRFRAGEVSLEKAS